MTRREGGVQCVMGGGVKNIFFTPCMAVMCAIDFVACVRPAILSLHVLKTFAKLLHLTAYNSAVCVCAHTKLENYLLKTNR